MHTLSQSYKLYAPALRVQPDSTCYSWCISSVSCCCKRALDLFMNQLMTNDEYSLRGSASLREHDFEVRCCQTWQCGACNPPKHLLNGSVERLVWWLSEFGGEHHGQVLHMVCVCHKPCPWLTFHSHVIIPALRLGISAKTTELFQFLNWTWL